MEAIERFKAKFDPQVVFLRWKKVKDLAVLKYARKELLNYVLDVLREAIEDKYDLTFPFSARFWRYSRELVDLALTEPESARRMWIGYGLPPEEFDYFLEEIRRISYQSYLDVGEWWIDTSFRIFPVIRETFQLTPQTGVSFKAFFPSKVGNEVKPSVTINVEVKKEE